MRANISVLVIFICILSLCACGGASGPSTAKTDTTDGDTNSNNTYASIPKDFWGTWTRIGSKTEYYVSDLYIERTTYDPYYDIPTKVKYAFVGASSNEASGFAAVDCGDVLLASKGSLFLASDAQADQGGGTPFYVTRRAPLNKIAAEAGYQEKSGSRSGGRVLRAAGNINLVIRNALHNQAQTVKTDPAGNFTIPDAVPGDTYKVTPQAEAGAAPVTFDVVSTPNMETSEGGTISIPTAEVSGAFKATLEYQTSSVEGRFVDAFDYHYAGLSYGFKLKIVNSGRAASLASVSVAWEGAELSPAPAFASLAGSFDAEGSKESELFQLQALAPAAGSEYRDLKGVVTMTDSAGLQWTDRVAHRFYIRDIIAVGISGKGISFTLIDPEGKTVGVGDSALVPRRAAGYRLAVVNADSSPGAPNAYYSVGVSDITPGSDGLIRNARVPNDVSIYELNSSAYLSFESAGGTALGNNVEPAIGAAASEDLTLRPGESVVSCANYIEGSSDIDWFVIKGDPSPRAMAMRDAGLPFAAEFANVFLQASPGIGDAAFVLDGVGNPNIFYYSWADKTLDDTVAGLKLEHAYRTGSSWSTETIVDLSESHPQLAWMWDATPTITPFENADGSWTVVFYSWGAELDPNSYVAYGRPRLASGRSGGAWGVGSYPADRLFNVSFSAADDRDSSNLDLPEPPIAWRDMAGKVHLAYRSPVDNFSVQIYYSKAEGLEWSKPIPVMGQYGHQVDLHPVTYGFDLSGADIVIYGEWNGYPRTWSLGGEGSYVSEPFGETFTLFSTALQPGALDFFKWPERPDCKPFFAASFGTDKVDLRLFTSLDGADYSALWVGEWAGATWTGYGNDLINPPVERDRWRLAATKYRGLVVQDTRTFRNRHLPELSGTSAPHYAADWKARLALALDPAGKAFALMRWGQGIYWGYILYEEQ